MKPCRLGRPTGTITLCPHEEFIIMDSILRTPQIQLYEIANQIINATGSEFGVEILCRAVFRLEITRRKVRFVTLQSKYMYFCITLYTIKFVLLFCVIYLDTANCTSEK